MKTKLPPFLYLLLSAVSFLLACPPLRASDLLKGLNAAEVAAVDQGKLLYIAHEVPNMPWPRAVVYHFVEASPREVLAVFTNYNSASTYIPNVLQSKVVNEIRPWEKEVYYELEVPVLPNETYVAKNLLSFVDNGKQMEVSWTAAKAKFFKSSVGNLRVEAYRSGTLLRYTNLVDPGSRIATILRSTAEAQVKATVAAIVNRVITLKTKHPAEMAKELETFDKILETLPGAKKN